MAGTSFTSKFLRANGIMLYKVRDETIKLLGKADMYFFSPEHPPLTEDAQRALDSAVNQKLKAGLSHVLTQLFCEMILVVIIVVMRATLFGEKFTLFERRMSVTFLALLKELSLAINCSNLCICMLQF